MAAFLASFLSVLLPAIRNRFFCSAASKSYKNIPLPAVPHTILDSQTLARFEEVLVIGDVHGCYDELLLLLDKVSRLDSPALPDREKDSKILKIFVGDLVNKGPKNRQVIQHLMRERDTCISVRGNHDDVLVDQVLNVIRKEPQRLRPKNQWMLEVTNDELHFIMDLPYSISIPSLRALVVHAGIIPGVSVQDMSPADLVCMRNLIKEGHGFKATSRDTEGIAWAKAWSGPVHVYFGHDAKRLLQVERFATGLDTGCVYGRDLTAVFVKGPRKGQFISVKARETYQEVTEFD